MNLDEFEKIFIISYLTNTMNYNQVVPNTLYNTQALIIGERYIKNKYQHIVLYNTLNPGLYKVGTRSSWGNVHQQTVWHEISKIRFLKFTNNYATKYNTRSIIKLTNYD